MRTVSIRALWFSRVGLTALAGLLPAVSLQCVPIVSELGGTRPPPDINGDGRIPVDATRPDSPPSPDASQTMVFDVTVEASSLSISGITIDATLTVVMNQAASDGEAGPTYSEVTLRDTFNSFGGGSQDVGISGGIFLTAKADVGGTAGGFFTLSETPDGKLSGTLAAGGNSQGNPNLFVLQPEGTIFEPGVVGITYEVSAGSRFDFQIDGDQVSGELNLTGTPVDGPGDVENYIGVITGRAVNPP